MGTESDHDLLIRLDSKLDSVIEKMGEIPSLTCRVNKLENTVQLIPDMKDDIKKLEEKSNTWSIINSIGVFVAGLFGFLKWEFIGGGRLDDWTDE